MWCSADENTTSGADSKKLDHHQRRAGVAGAGCGGGGLAARGLLPVLLGRLLLRDMRTRGNLDRLPSAPRRGVPGPLGLGAAASVAVAVNRDRG